MASLGDLARTHANLDEPSVAHLHSLVAEWQVLADLSFADLLLYVRIERQPPPPEPTYLCIAQIRPTTGPTLYGEDMVGATVNAAERFAVDRAWREGRIVREGEPEWRDGVPVREEGIPVRRGEDVIAVLGRDTNLAAARTPSALELAYLAAASDLAQMVSEGRFPFVLGEGHLPGGPRVGDGLVRLDATGNVVFASPNALSALRRLGATGNVVGGMWSSVMGELALSSEGGDGRVDAVLDKRRPIEGEVMSATGDVAVRLRAVPLVPGGTLLGALVLLRDVTEVRRRDRQLVTKDATIREIHHRVKNNLQTVAALLRLQARRTNVAEARLALEESVRRVTSIAVVHETLSQAMDESVAFDGIADTIAAVTVDLATSREGARVATAREGTFGVLPAQVATPLALVLSELLANAVEHAYEGGSGAITVRARRSASGLEVVVVDEGPGLPEGFAVESAGGLGLQIVRTLVVGEMRGTFGLRPHEGGGTEAVVAVPAAQL
ncbi:MAG TPA: histidine kinase N-terminal domain-containing protein [Mycobacteriales bacterium]|nr:histidine kinase N-terminal domain-containing protein [Mycobacteriales bacterium]